MSSPLDGNYSLKAFNDELKQRMEGIPSYLRDGRFVNRKNDIEKIVKDSITKNLKELFFVMDINEDAIKATYKDNEGTVDVHFENDIVKTPAELEIFIAGYKKVMGQLPPMTITLDEPVTRLTTTIKVVK